MIIRWFVFIPIEKWNLILKNGGKQRFSYETKASMSFILISGMSLQCPIIKRKEITIWIHVCLNWETNFNSKEWWRGKLFLRNKTLMSFIPMRTMSLWCSIMKKKEIVMWIRICPNWQMNFNFVIIEKQTLILKKREWKGFLMKPKSQCHLS